MSLINMLDANLKFSDAIPLLDNAELHIEDNERVCLVGCNGAGKSTLIRVLTKEQSLDNGQIIYQQNLQVAHLQQDPPRNIDGTIFDFIAEGAKEQINYIKLFHKTVKNIEQDPSKKNLNKLSQLQDVLDRNNLWLLDAQINDIIKKLKLTTNSDLSTLSGGCFRKAVLARTLISKPHVLFLDEPTNHLDIDTIVWLENFLKSFQGSIVFVSHDRSFISNIATRIIDLDRGKLTSWSYNYNDYLKNKEETLRVERRHNAEFDHKLEKEEIWIRQGIKARRTRNEGRLKILKSLRIKRLKRHDIIKATNMQIQEADRSGKLVFDIKNINYHIDNKIIIDNFSVKIQRGDKIALIGPNGSGKTTFLKLILGQLNANNGNIYRGTKLKIVYFDQHRLTLDLDKTAIDNLSEGKQEIIVNGQFRNAISYLCDFLFHPKQVMTPVRALSGGERNRLLLACLFLKPSNLFILDEPTNDLDIETLELLEELINSYKGTVILVSHDRQFIENTVTECWMFKKHGKIDRYIGGFYESHLQSKEKSYLSYSTINKSNTIISEISKKYSRRKNNKISYNLLRELKQLPIQIEALETKISILQSQVNESEFFNQSHIITESVLKTLSEKEAEMESIFKRWQELELLNKHQ
ncbi:MAG: ABC transporter ATP-binding protein [Arsenophonus sp.]